MFIPIPVLVVAIVVGLVIFALMRTGRGGRDPLEDVGGSFRRTTGTAPLPLPATPEEIDAQARLLMSRRRKIEAIKLVRETTGMSLKDAKDYVERL